MSQEIVARAVNHYDEVPYPGCAFPQTHPDRLAILATVFGMKPAALENCRILELGCGDGGNLIPIASGLPQSQSVGIDLSANAIAKAQEIVQALGLKNVVFRCLDLLETSASSLGTFDYIIAHGLYSWVGPEVRDKIMEICNACLAPQGVAFVSYNAYPGGHLRNMVREMMLFHARDFADPRERTRQARALVKFIADSGCGAPVYQALIKRHLSAIEERSNSVVYHDDLAETNCSVYFSQFMEHASRHGLQYVSEADMIDMQELECPPEVAEKMRMLGDHTIAQEQYRDFLVGRMFRQTLLCHQDVSLDRAMKSAHLRLFYVAASVSPVSKQPDIQSRSLETFRDSKGATLETDHPLAKAALMQLGEVWPQCLRFDDLLKRARARIGAASDPDGRKLDEDAALLENVLWKMSEGGLVEFHFRAPDFVSQVSERPVASSLARFQIGSGNTVTTLRHTNVHLEDPLTRHLLGLLDGSRDRAALLKEMNRFVESGAAATPQNDKTVGPEEKNPNILADALEENLVKTARLALLVA